jgi:hypothetical protein
MLEFFGLIFIGGIALLLYLGDRTERDLRKELDEEVDSYLDDML